MKAIVTLILILFFGSLAIAQDSTSAVQNFDDIKTFAQKELVQPVQSVDKVQPTADEMARLYRFKNSRVLKELTFVTKRNKAKLA